MRNATLTLRWDRQGLHPVDARFAAETAITVEAIHFVSPGPEGEFVELLELSGKIDRIAAVLDDIGDVLDYDITGSDERSIASVQCRSVGMVSDLLDTLHDNEIVVDWPIRYLDGSARGFTVTVLGTDAAIQQAAATLPEEISVTLERIGEYDPSSQHLSALLTPRQQKVLDIAVENGYYEIPRQTTHRELATYLDIATGTVGEHLQRIESKLVDAYLRR